MQAVVKNTGKGRQDGSEGLAAKPRDPHSIPRTHTGRERTKSTRIKAVRCHHLAYSVS